MGKEVIERIPFVQAKWYTETKEGRFISLIVLHSMEAPEKGGTAEAVANYFKNGSGGRKASAHFNVDSNSIVQSVQTKDIAYGASNANRNGIHIELAGYARQTAAEWQDEFSTQMLKNAAWLCAKILCPKYDIPTVFLSGEKLRSVKTNFKVKGFTTHAAVNEVWGSPSGHWDPGKGFPMKQFLFWVQDAKRDALK